MIRIHNVRLGHATNSSSSHSVIFNGKGGYNSVPKAPTWEFEGGEYSWEDFHLTSASGKAEYLLAGIWSPIKREFGKKVGSIIVRAVFSGVLKFTDDDDELYSQLEGSYIDHQSTILLPDGQMLSNIMEHLRLITDERVTIRGGNDNDWEPEYRENERNNPDFTCGVIGNGDLLRVRYDEKADVYVVYNSASGAKIRFGQTAAYTKAFSPELVDMKITDKCSFGCAFCYQGSTKKGEHANASSIAIYLKMLANNGVFEVAIGGGEPMEHPNIAEIVILAKKYGVTPNITTRDVTWTLDNPLRKTIFKYCGGIGVSVNALEDRARLGIINGYRKYGDAQVVAQVVVGASPPEVFNDILAYCLKERVPVLLLGWKDVGRGARYATHDVSTVLQKMMPKFKDEWVQLSVDTAFAEAYPKLLANIDVKELLIAPREGAFSCYIDAVKGTIHSSSYDGTEGTELFTWEDNLKEEFAKF